MKRQAAVFVTVPADELVGDFRLRRQPRAVARNLPPHITVLPPFWREPERDDVLAESFAQHFATLARFAAELTRVGTFSRHVWLAPEPHEDFVALIAGTRDRFPALVRDPDREPIPHLTIGEAGKGESVRVIAQKAEEEIAPRLPFAFDVQDVGLFEARPEGWCELRRFPLG